MIPTYHNNDESRLPLHSFLNFPSFYSINLFFAFSALYVGECQLVLHSSLLCTESCQLANFLAESRRYSFMELPTYLLFTPNLFELPPSSYKPTPLSFCSCIFSLHCATFVMLRLYIRESPVVTMPSPYIVLISLMCVSIRKS